MSDHPVHDHRLAGQSSAPASVDGARGAPLRFWRSLGELAEGSRARWQVPPRLADAADLMSRQQFLKLMGASVALAGLTACAHEGDHGIAPYVRRPEGIVLGQSQYYATALTLGGYANGVLVRSYAGRPVKVEGNPSHPASLGGTTIYDQAATYTFYDPDRSKEVISGGTVQTFEDFEAALTSAVGLHKQKQGDGMRILTETVTSPTLADQIASLLKAYPSAKWHQWEPINLDNVRAGAHQAFGQDAEVVYRVDQADVIVTLDADLFGAYPGGVRYARDWAAKRTVTSNTSTQNRMYSFETTPTITGAVADHRVPVPPSDVEGVARAIAAGVGVGGASGTTVPTGVSIALLNAAIRDLTQHRGTSLVVAGEGQPPVVHVLAHQINQALGNAGKTVVYTDPVVASPASQLDSIKALVTDINGGKVDLLVILGGNPAYDAPADLGFANALKKVATSFHVGLFRDETGSLATWHAPMAHELESWGDARAYDGTATIIQPLIEPLYGGHTAAEIMSIMVSGGLINGRDLVKAYWQSKQPSGNFGQAWAGWLNDGVIPNTAAAPKTLTLAASAAPPAAAAPAASGVQLVFRPDPTVFDGRFANNSLLQELPKPLTKTTWDNVALVSPSTAGQLGISGPTNYQNTGYASGFARPIITLSYQGGEIRAPAWIMPGQPENTITVQLGYGRMNAGSVGNDRGYNGYLLRTSQALWSNGGLQVAVTDQTYPVADTQVQQTMADPLGNARDVVLAGTLADFQKNPKIIQDAQPVLAGTLYPPYGYGPPLNRWAMSINLSTCIGCGACEAACYAENNIPIVGKEQVMADRIMHWIRVDRYFEGNADAPATYAMPVPCQQCENAPCELVCPVQATAHSADGLNDMVYNRCVGTRYCSNNCPYKVRRFNFFKFADWETPSLKLMRNPDVSVRERGVMEKCTYCVQRIRHAEIHAQVEGNRPIKDGEVVTACAAACPTRAIVFGDMNDPNAQVTKLKQLPTNYDLLKELNTRPRTSYLGAMRNPSPDITAT